MILEKSLFSAIQDVRNKKLPDVYLFFGDIEEFKSLIIEEIKNFLNIFYENAPILIKKSLSEILKDIDKLHEKVLFSLPQIYWLKDCQENMNAIKTLPKTIKKKPKENLLILDYSIPKWRWNKAEYLKGFQKDFINLEIHYIECFTIPIKYLPAWIINFCKLYQFNIEKEAINYIVNALGNEISIIIKELKKIFLYILPQKNITLEASKASLSGYSSITDFQFYDLFAEKNKEKLIESILLYKYRNIEPIAVCRGIRNEIEKMVYYMENPTEAQLIKLGINIKSIPFLQKRISNFKKNELLSALFILDKVEKSLKENTKLGWIFLLNAILNILKF